MNVAVLVYRRRDGARQIEASLQWTAPLAGRTLYSVPVPLSLNVMAFPKHDCAIVGYLSEEPASNHVAFLDIYRISDWSLQRTLPMNCHAHFNVGPRWSTFLESPAGDVIYIYKSNALGDHLAEDFICGLNLSSLELCAWESKLPDCVAGWSGVAGPAHAQMLFVASGVHCGALPTHDLTQQVGFWLGPHEGMGPSVSLGPRPRVHNALGHARAILSAAQAPLSLVVFNDGTIHLIDPLTFRYLDQQRASFAAGHAMPNCAARVEPTGRLLYIGTSAGNSRSMGLIERIVVHDLERNRLSSEWILSEPFVHMTLCENGTYLCGASYQKERLKILDTTTGNAVAVLPLDGRPVYVTSD